MIFVDTNVFMYALARPHPLQSPAQDFFAEANWRGEPLCTSAEVMQELAQAYLPTGRLQTYDAALALMDSPYTPRCSQTSPHLCLHTADHLLSTL